MKSKRLFKRKYIYIIIIPTFLLFFNGIMIIFPQEIISGAEKGLLLWFNRIIPSLLPFIICANMLVKLNFPRTMGMAVGKFTNKFFKLRGECVFPVVTGIISGYPLGIKTAAELYKQGLITKTEAERLFFFANNSGPLFILGTVGVGMFNSPKTGYFLMFVHYISSFIIMIATGFFYPSNKNTVKYKLNQPDFSFGKIMGESVVSAVNTVISIGGYIILFSVINTVLFKTGAIIPIAKIFRIMGLEGNEAVGTAVSIFEITNGCNILSNVKSKLAVILCGSVISWGGLSVHAQTVSIIGETGLSSKTYLAGKTIHALLSFVIGYFILFGLNKIFEFF